MTHLTLASPFGRKALCGADRIQSFTDGSGDRFMGAIYVANLADPCLCPACVTMWVRLDRGEIGEEELDALSSD